MVSAGSVSGAPRPLGEPRRRTRARAIGIKDLAGILGAALLHAGVLGLAFVAPRRSLVEGFWVPVTDAVDVEIDRTPAAVVVPELPRIGASQRAEAVPAAPFVRPDENRALRESVMAPARTVDLEARPVTPACAEYDSPSPPLPFPRPSAVGSGFGLDGTTRLGGATRLDGLCSGDGDSYKRRSR